MSDDKLCAAQGEAMKCLKHVMFRIAQCVFVVAVFCCVAIAVAASAVWLVHSLGWPEGAVLPIIMVEVFIVLGAVVGVSECRLGIVR